MNRLAAASGVLPEELQALSALAGGELSRAELLEERAQAQWSEPWGVYLIAKAARLAVRGGDLAAARGALAQVPRNWHASAAYWQAKAQVAAAASDAAGQHEAQARLAALAAVRWEAIAWRQVGGRALLEMYLGEPRQTATLTLDALPARGAVIQVELDGASLGEFVVDPRQPSVRLELGAGPGLHLLELRTLAGEKVAPGELKMSS
jgi:hypothetical protein